MNSSTFAFCSSATRSSASDTFTRPNLLHEDLLHRRALLVAGDLTLGRVPLRDREPLRGPELLRDRLHPLDELLQPGARRDRLAALEIEQVAGEPVPDRAPHVLLEQAVRPRRQRLALVVRAGAARGERVAQRGDRARLTELGLRVADPDLDRRIREMR